MTGRSGVRLAVGILAAFAAGCGSSRPFQSGVIARAADKNPPGPVDNRYAAPAAASSWPAPRRPVNPATTWPQPEYTRANYADELGPGQPAGEPAPRPASPTAPVPVPPTVTPPAYHGGGYDRGGPPPPPDPTVLKRPSAVGGAWELGPNESPIDRAVELSRKIELVSKENLALLARIRQLEAQAEARETALNETLRDVQNASDEVIRTRTELQNLRKDLAALKARVMQVEKDEAETLKAVIAAIEKLLQQAPDTNKK
jgi:hypothetical protein